MRGRFDQSVDGQLPSLRNRDGSLRHGLSLKGDKPAGLSPGAVLSHTLPKANTGKIVNFVRGKNRTLNGISDTSEGGGGPSLDVVKQLLRVDWRETGMKLAAYAAFRSRNLSWRTGSDVALAKGLMPDDIAAQAIVSVIGGERKWEPERGPLLPFLKRVVDSLLNHLALSADNRRIERLSQNDRSPYRAERIAFRNDDEGPSPRCPAEFNVTDPSDSESDADERIERLVEAAKAAPELAEVLNAILDFDEARPRLIALRIGKPVNHVNNCLKRLRRLALKISTEAEGPLRHAEQSTHE